MSYKERLIDLDRDGELSLTEQLARVFTEAIESGELAPGERLPPTRELAERAGINHLTAVRSYKRLRELGLVTAQVGRGTFVRDAPQPAAGIASLPGTAWQSYVLPEWPETYGDRVIAEMFRRAGDEGGDVIPLSVGFPSRRLYPEADITAATEAVLARGAGHILDYAEIAGETELRTELAEAAARARRRRRSRRARRNQWRPPGPHARGAGPAASRRRRRLRGTELLGPARFDPRGGRTPARGAGR